MTLAPARNLAGRCVLIVEDESMVAMLIQDTLEDMGCVVVGLAPRFHDAMEKDRKSVV